MADPAQNIKHMEDVTVVTLLGIRFWDAALDDQVRDGLAVTARPEPASGKPVDAFRTASGLYAFQGLPGLHDYETGSTDLLASPPANQRFVVQVEDRRRRFLPVLFHVTLPLPYRGVYPTSLASPPGGEGSLPGFYLFSAPTRPAAPGLAVVRARLVAQASQRPAAHAVLEIEVREELWRGIADERGQVAVLFPYPTMDISLHDSPPGMLSTPLQQQRWGLTVRVAYEPSALDYPDGEELPTLASILDQSPGVLWPSQSGRPVDKWTWSLAYGRELVLRTDDLSDLWIDGGTSPP